MTWCSRCDFIPYCWNDGSHDIWLKWLTITTANRTGICQLFPTRTGKLFCEYSRWNVPPSGHKRGTNMIHLAVMMTPWSFTTLSLSNWCCVTFPPQRRWSWQTARFVVGRCMERMCRMRRIIATLALIRQLGLWIQTISACLPKACWT